MKDLWHFEQEAAQRGCKKIAGIDEAGRGPWAGPVVAAAVILDVNRIPHGLNDSKKLPESKRESLFEEIMKSAEVGVGIADVARIDGHNILNATMWAMEAALSGLSRPSDYVLIDGNRMPDLPCASETVVKGDGRSLSIAAASVAAKVTRDRAMADHAREFPGYGWERNQGYGTAEHRAGIARLGITPLHRRSFRPVREALEIPS